MAEHGAVALREGRSGRRAVRCGRSRPLILTLLIAMAVTMTACSAASAPGGPSRHAHTAAAASQGPTAQPAGVPHGRIMSRQIPGAGSGFHPRAAMIYLPPAVAKEPHLRLPLLVLLHGQPGAPSDWLDKGSAATVLDDFAATHHGQTPVVVMPDINGSDAGDTGCVHAPGGANVERYLNTVVPRWALEHLPITSARSEWAIAGLSEGGTCAAMLALRAYPGYRLFGDFSGLAHLTVGPRNNPPATIAQLFGGSRTAYDQHDPILLMQQNRYPRLAALFVCGAADHTVLADQNQMIAQARSAAITVRSAMHPGGHDWSIWHQALSQLLPWFWTLSQP